MRRTAPLKVAADDTLSGVRPGKAWGVVVGSALALSVSNGPIAVFAFGVFIPPLIREFGWSRAEVSLALTLFTLSLGLTGPLFGTLIDRYGQRRPQLVSVAALSALLAAVSLVHSLTAFLVLFAFMGLIGPGATPVPYSKVVSAWFDNRRGLALGLAMTGTGIGSVMLPPISTALVGAYGWRGGFVGLAAAVATVSLPAIFFLIREPPRVRFAVVAPHGRSVMTWASVLIDSRFWFIGVPAGLLATAISGTLVHLPTMLGDRGLPAATVARIVAASGFASLIGRLTTGALLDTFFAPFVAAATYLLGAAGFLALVWQGPIGLVWLGAILLGLGIGAEVDLVGYLVSRYFPMFAYGRIYGAIFLLFSVGNGAGAYLSGLCFDLTGAYNYSLYAYCGAMLACALLTLRLGPYRFAPGATITLKSAT